MTYLIDTSLRTIGPVGVTVVMLLIGALVSWSTSMLGAKLGRKAKRKGW